MAAVAGRASGASRRDEVDTSSHRVAVQLPDVYAGERVRSEQDGQGAFTGVNRRKRVRG
jgi:hypothetical protein